VRFETLGGDFLHAVTFVLRKTLGEDRGIGNDRVMDSRVGYQICLKLGEVNIQGPIEAEGRSDGGNDYRY